MKTPEKPTQNILGENGVASIEFAFIAPLLAIAITGLVDVGLYINAKSNMTASLKSGVDYFLTGGNHTDTAIAVVEHAWTTRPEYSTVNAERFCTCSNVISACTSICIDGTQPDAFKKIVLTAYYDGLLLSTKYQSDETVRIR